MTRNAWGGARAGAGRRARGPITSEPHKTRRSFSNGQIRIVARVTDGLPSLRTGAARSAIAGALERTAQRHDFAVLSIVIRSKRLELVVAADHHLALARGMQGLQVSAAKRLNQAVGRRGVVFPDRYRIASLAGTVAATGRRPTARVEPARANLPIAIPPSWTKTDAQPTLRRAIRLAIINPRRLWWL